MPGKMKSRSQSRAKQQCHQKPRSFCSMSPPSCLLLMADPLPTPGMLSLFLSLQLEQKQKEALELLEQNRHLQDQLKVALGREQSAREGYVLQVGAWGGERNPFYSVPEGDPGGLQSRVFVEASWLTQRGAPLRRLQEI